MTYSYPSIYTSVSRHKNKILCREILCKMSGNISESDIIQYEPTLYNISQAPIVSNFKTFKGQEILEPIQFSSMFDINNYPDHEKLHGNRNFPIQYINDNYPCSETYQKEYDDALRIMYIDIEVHSEDGFPDPSEAKYPITSITCIVTDGNNHCHDTTVFCKDRINQWSNNNIISLLVYDNEYALLKDFLEYFQTINPHIISGWNTSNFDIPYIINRANNCVLFSLKVHKKLSQFSIIEQQIKSFRGRQTLTYKIHGVQHLDYLDLFRKFGYVYGQQESYRLDHIAHTVLGKGKLSYEEYGSLSELYHKDYSKYVEYNIRDTELIYELEKKCHYIDLARKIAYKAGCNFEDTLGTTGVWDALVNKELLKKNIVPPPKNFKDSSVDDNEDDSYEGGYVKEPLKGKFNYIGAFDISSLYPNIVIQQNMSPETICNNIAEFCTGVEKSLKFISNGIEIGKYNDEHCFKFSASGAAFKGDHEGIFPYIFKHLYSERMEIREKMKGLNSQSAEYISLDNTQTAIKILANSGYGALANKYFRYYDKRIAEAITLTGQLIIRFAEKFINDSFKKDVIIASDTDSLYVDFDSVYLKIQPNFAFNLNDVVLEEAKREILNILKQIIIRLFNTAMSKLNQRILNVTESEKRIILNHELTAKGGCWIKKKNYFLNVIYKNDTWLKQPVMKIMGLNAVKSSTPKFLRDALKDMYQIALTQDRKAISILRDIAFSEFKTLPLEEIALPTSVNNIEEYICDYNLYKKGTPIHVRAAIRYNERLTAEKLIGKYRKITSGDKMKYLFLKLPNPIQENVIGFPDILPPEIGLHKYIDYDSQFHRGFEMPCNIMCNALSWPELTKTENSLEELF